MMLTSLLIGARRPQRLIERSLMVYRRTWLVLVSGFFEPLFYLLSIRIGLGSLVGAVDVGARQMPYAEFVAPGLMAAAAMNGAIFDSTMNVFHKWKHARLYDSLLATPLSAADVAVGEITFAVLRGVLYSAAFLVTMVALGLVSSAWMLLSLAACALIGSCFAALGMAATTYVRSWSDFEYLPAITLPLFLFSATFYPVSTYGDWAWVLQLSPLYHGVSLIRTASLGEWSWAIPGHAAVLAGLTLAGTAVATRRVGDLLLT